MSEAWGCFPGCSSAALDCAVLAPVGLRSDALILAAAAVDSGAELCWPFCGGGSTDKAAPFNAVVGEVVLLGASACGGTLPVVGGGCPDTCFVSVCNWEGGAHCWVGATNAGIAAEGAAAGCALTAVLAGAPDAAIRARAVEDVEV